MPGALWLIALPIGFTPLIYLLRRTKTGAIIAAVVACVTAWLAVQLPVGVVLNLLGRTIELDQLSQVTLALLFAATAALFLLLALFSFVSESNRGQRLGVSGQISRGVRIFYPAALVILGLFVAASLSRHLGITAIFIELAAILTVFVIQTERLESTRAALRFLVLMSVATPLFLLAAWQIDVEQLAGESNIELIALFVGLGFAVWLAVVPFHGWMTSTTIESSPPMAAFVLVTFPVVAFSTFIQLLVDLPWLTDSLYFVDAMILAGVFTAFFGGMLASVQRGFSELLGYASLFNLGCILVMLGLGGQAAVIAVLVSLVIRALALVLIAVSGSTLYLRGSGNGFIEIKGAARQMPVALAGLVLGGLTLAGVPLTAGFAPYWQLLQTVSMVDARWLVLLAVGGLGVAIGYLRGLRAGLSDKQQTGSKSASFGQEPLPLLVLIVLLGGSILLLGVFPWLLIEPLQTVTATISFPID